MIDTPLKECLQRIRNDPQRNRSRRKFERLAAEWHEKYKQSLQRVYIPPPCGLKGGENTGGQATFSFPSGVGMRGGVKAAGFRRG